MSRQGNIISHKIIIEVVIQVLPIVAALIPGVLLLIVIFDLGLLGEVNAFVVFEALISGLELVLVEVLVHLLLVESNLLVR